MTTSRKTFVVSLREEDGTATLHEVHTGRKASLGSLREIPGQIETWLREGTPRPETGLARARGEARVSTGEQRSGAGT